MSGEDKVLRTMRTMAWERAKGELRSMLQTYWDDENSFLILENKIDSFIKDIEDTGSHE